MKAFLRSFSLFVIVASAFGASGAFAAPQKQQPAAAPHASMSPMDASQGPLLSGKVVETMDAGGYTYVRIEKDGKKTWVAIPLTKVIVGQELSFTPGAEMANFTSKSLNKTFDSIIFSGGIAGEAGAAGHGGKSGQGGGSKAAATAQDKSIKVEKAAGPDAYTVSEIFEKRAALNGKSAVVKAQVVKVTADVMNRNWIHLQDGSGDAKKGNHNLVATSNDLPKVGDVVTVKGKIVKDKDFGSGYKYKVIMEEAKVQE